MTKKTNIIPGGGVNLYAGHPGFPATDCALRRTVTPAASGSSSSYGFGCYFNSGHCLPSFDCERRRQVVAVEIGRGMK